MADLYCCDCAHFGTDECDAQCESDCACVDFRLPKPGDGAGFIECPACAAKAGSPLLCASCLHNRALIERLSNAQTCGDCEQFGGEACGAQDRMAPICPDFLEMI